MAEYEMIAFRDDQAEPVDTQWFGDRPADEWVRRLAEESGLGEFLSKDTFPNVTLNYDNGYIEVRKHANNLQQHPPAKKRTK